MTAMSDRLPVLDTLTLDQASDDVTAPTPRADGEHPRGQVDIVKRGTRWMIARTRYGLTTNIYVAATKAEAVAILAHRYASLLDTTEDDPRDAEIEALRKRVHELDWRHADHDWLDRQLREQRHEVEALRNCIEEILGRVFSQGRPNAVEPLWERAYRAAERLPVDPIFLNPPEAGR